MTVTLSCAACCHQPSVGGDFLDPNPVDLQDLHESARWLRFPYLLAMSFTVHLDPPRRTAYNEAAVLSACVNHVLTMFENSVMIWKQKMMNHHYTHGECDR